MKNAILSLAFLGFVAGTAANAVADISPDVLAKTTTEEVLEILRNNKDIRTDPKKVTELVEEKSPAQLRFHEDDPSGGGQGLAPRLARAT